MLTRIVKLRISKDKADDFEAIFHKGKSTIRNFEGCEFLELWKEFTSSGDEVIFMTHSKWINEKFLNLYRASDFFKQTWAQSKLLFAGKPEAWSVSSIDKLV